MLTYTPPSDTQPLKPTERPWLLLLLCLIWLVPGLVGHHPWKPDEPASIGIIDAMLDSGNWLVPSLAGEPTLERSPFFYQLATLMAKWLAPGWLQTHDAARLATGLFMALALACAGGAGRELVGRRSGRVVVMVMVGCLGLLLRGHALSPDAATLAGYAAAVYGMALALRLPGLAGLALGVGSGLAGASASLFEPAAIWMVAILLPACFRYWRSREYLITLVLGALVALPWLVLWPFWLWRTSPDLFSLWWSAGATWRLQGIGFAIWSRELAYYLSLLPWFAWPALPLAGWTLWDSRLLGYARPHVQMPVLMLSVWLALMLFSPAPKEGYALPLLIPLSLLASAGIDRLRRGAAAALNWFGIMTFGLLAIYLWIGWTAAQFGIPARLVERGVKVAPGFVASLNVAAVLLAIVLTLAWVWAVSRRRQRGRQAVTSWAAGVTLSWSLLMLLWLPGVDWVRGYQLPAAELGHVAGQAKGCIATRNMSTAQVALFHYYTDLPLVSEMANPGSCDWVLIQGGQVEISPAGSWVRLWEGGRPGDSRERFRLYRRNHDGAIPL